MYAGIPVVKVVVVAVAMWAFALTGTSLASPPSTPEINPGSFGSVLAVVLGSLALLERRRSA